MNEGDLREWMTVMEPNVLFWTKGEGNEEEEEEKKDRNEVVIMKWLPQKT